MNYNPALKILEVMYSNSHFFSMNLKNFVVILIFIR